MGLNTTQNEQGLLRNSNMFNNIRKDELLWTKTSRRLS